MTSEGGSGIEDENEEENEKEEERKIPELKYESLDGLAGPTNTPHDVSASGDAKVWERRMLWVR